MPEDKEKSWVNRLSGKPRVMRDMVPKAPLKPSVSYEPIMEPSLRPAPASKKERNAEKQEEDKIKTFFSSDEERKSRKREESEEPKLRVNRWLPRRSARTKLWLWSGGVAGALVAVVVLLSTVFARTSITVEPLVETRTISPMVVTVTPEAHAVDTAKKILPGELIELLETKEIRHQATGKKVVNERARGTVSIYNAFSGVPQVLIANTRFSAPDGKIFRLVKAVTVPGAKIKNGTIVPSAIEAEVMADAAGEAYNIGPAEFRIPGFRGDARYQGFYGKSEKEFEGGFEGEASVVTDADLREASEEVTREVYRYLKEILKTRIPEGFVILDGGHEVDITNVSGPSVNSRANEFIMRATGRARGIVFRTQDEEDMVAALFSAVAPYTLVSDGSALKRGSISLDLSRRVLSFSLSGDAKLERTVDQEAIREGALGKKSRELEEMLAKSGNLKAYRVKFFPFWVQRVPENLGSVSLTVKSLAGE